MSKGINVYDQVHGQFGSIMEAKASELTKQAASEEPCIFLSHNHDAITLSIERGITASTDLIAFVSEKTFDSCWVPYEIGFGKRAEKYLSALRLNDIPELPSYLNIRAVRRLEGVTDLNTYLKKVKTRESGPNHFSGTLGYLRKLTEEAETDKVLPDFSSYHTLRNYLDK